jgi:hypothetical protein
MDPGRSLLPLGGGGEGPDVSRRVVLGGQDADNFVELVILVPLIGGADDAGRVDGGSIWICKRYY